jgi:hypothetical protein
MCPVVAPTQTHILLRAPRRFVHPAWTPRQNLTSSLDTMLSDFQRNSGLIPAAVAQHRSRPKAGVKTEGVLVGCVDVSQQNLTGEAEGTEDDEMIWWCWNGRLSGFSEWA